MRRARYILSSLFLSASVAKENVFPRDVILTTVEKSPAAVARKDKEAWLDLFHCPGTIQDPVGTAPYRSFTIVGEANSCHREPHSSFYETFIAPNKIVFDVHQDIVNGNEIVRDLHIVTTLKDSGITIRVPTFLLYKVQADDKGNPKIGYLEAYWELYPMVSQVIGAKNGFPTAMGIFGGIFGNQGISGMMGYIKGLVLGVYDHGKKVARRFQGGLNSGNMNMAKGAFHLGQAKIEYPVASGSALDLDSFLKQFGDRQMTLTEIRSAGYYTIARFQETTKSGTAVRAGVVFFKFNSLSLLIEKMRFFWEEGSTGPAPIVDSGGQSGAGGGLFAGAGGTKQN